MTFYDAFASWLGELQHSPVFYEFMPDEPDELLAFFVYSTVPETQTIKRNVQIQVVRKDLMQAYIDAFKLSLILDSGIDEEKFNLPDGRWAIIRPLAKPRSLGYDHKRRSKYYIEIAVISEDRS